MTSPYGQALSAVAEQVEQPHRIDRVQLRKGQRIDFCINTSSWLSWNKHQLTPIDALTDFKIPAVTWAAAQPNSKLVVLAYRPRRRIVLLDCVRNQVIKGFSAGQTKRNALLHAVGAHAAQAAGLDVPSVVRVQLCNEAFAMQRCVGQPLAVFEEAGSFWHGLAAKLTSWQQQSVNLAPADEHSLNRFDANSELAVLHKLSARTIENMGDLPDRWDTVFRQLASASVIGSKSNLVLCHRDLHDGQLLKQGQQVTLLDFDSLCLGPAELDAGNFIAHFYLRLLQRPWRKESCVGTAVGSWLEGLYGEAHVSSPALRFYCASSFLRLALVYIVRPRWAHLAPVLVRMAERSLKAPQPMDRLGIA